MQSAPLSLFSVSACLKLSYKTGVLSAFIHKRFLFGDEKRQLSYLHVYGYDAKIHADVICFFSSRTLELISEGRGLQVSNHLAWKGVAVILAMCRRISRELLSQQWKDLKLVRRTCGRTFA